VHSVQRAGRSAPRFHGGSAPVLAKASPLAITGAAELDGRRLRLRCRGWSGSTSNGTERHFFDARRRRARWSISRMQPLHCGSETRGIPHTKSLTILGLHVLCRGVHSGEMKTTRRCLRHLAYAVSALCADPRDASHHGVLTRAASCAVFAPAQSTSPSERHPKAAPSMFGRG